MNKEKIIIYQLFPRIFGNMKKFTKVWGTQADNGCGKFNDISLRVLDSLKEMGVNHIWLTGIIRHASSSSYPGADLEASKSQILKGLAGSPYAIKDYYDVDPDLAVDVNARMDECDKLIARIHERGMKVLIDFVPNHVSRDYKSRNKPACISDLGEGDDNTAGFSPGNNFYYLPGQKLHLPGNEGDEGFNEYPAKATGNDVYSATPSSHDWYETVKLNYGIDPESGDKHFRPIPDTWIKMTEILMFWCQKGVDGFRCDMAGMVPVEFWNYATGRIREKYADILFIAEIYEPPKYREFIETGGFDYLYDKDGMYDNLREIICGRKHSDTITSVWQSLEGIDSHMLRFLENHDEQRLASRFFAGEPWKGIPGFALCALMNSGPVLLYNGQEVGEAALGSTGFSGDDGRTSIFDYCSMPELQKWFNNGACDGALLTASQKMLRNSYSDILNFAGSQKEIMGHFYDLMWQNMDLEDEVYAFLRYNSSSSLLIVISFSQDIKEINIRIPDHALGLTPTGIKERYTAKTLYPQIGESNLMLSQISGKGVNIIFDKTGWSAIRIS